jgi:SRSO17 transposase
MFKVFKPQGTLKQEDSYKTKIELASSIITELIDFGFNIELVLADSLYGEASSFIATLNKYKLPWLLSIINNHGVWMLCNQKVRANKWCKFERIFSNQKFETRYIREIAYGQRHQITYWEITTDPETMPENSTSFVMTNIQATRSQLKGSPKGVRTHCNDG